MYYIIRTIHYGVWGMGIFSATLCLYCLLADLTVVDKLTCHEPCFITFPVFVLIIRIPFKNRCPLTLLEKKLKSK